MALAMENIKNAANQHVTGTMQTEESSTRLHELGRRLKDLVGAFEV
jgi:hypothetical protein